MAKKNVSPRSLKYQFVHSKIRKLRFRCGCGCHIHTYIYTYKQKNTKTHTQFERTPILNLHEHLLTPAFCVSPQATRHQTIVTFLPDMSLLLYISLYLCHSCMCTFISLHIDIVKHYIKISVHPRMDHKSPSL